MSTLIKRILCNHQYKQLNPITLTCEKCGRMKKISCCHDWAVYSTRDIPNTLNGFYSKSILICRNCGKIIKVKNI